jgi:hypothetical protein
LTPCDKNPAACIAEALCEKATYQLGTSAPQWKSGDFKKFVEEAKLRGLTCGVGAATKKTTSINLNTQTSYDKCDASLTTCTDLDLCKVATIGTGNSKKWKVGAYAKYVNEVKRRGLSCGVVKKLSTPRVDTLQNTNQELKRKSGPGKISKGESGYVLIGDKRQSFLDILAKDPYAMSGANAIVFGYSDDFVSLPPNQSVGFRFELFIWEGILRRGLIFSTYESFKAIATYETTKLAGETISMTRERVFKELSKGNRRKGIYNLQGQFKNFRNTGELYFEINAIEVIK